MYKVEYQYGHTAALAATLIAENLFAQVDEEGNHSLLFDEIVDVSSDGTQVLQQDASVTTSSGTQDRVTKTKGWEVNLKWKDGSITWNKLKNIKDLYPVQLAEYAWRTEYQRNQPLRGGSNSYHGNVIASSRRRRDIGSRLTSMGSVCPTQSKNPF